MPGKHQPGLFRVVPRFKCGTLVFRTALYAEAAGMPDLLSTPLPAHGGVVMREIEAYGTAEVLADFAAHVLPELPVRQVCQEPGRLTVEWDQLADRPVVDIAALSERYPALLLVEIAEKGTRFWGPVIHRLPPCTRATP